VADVEALEAKEKLLGHQHPDMIKARASVTNANKIRTQRNLAFRLTRQLVALLPSFTLTCIHDLGRSRCQARRGV
jgi:hypothetical protein